MGDLKRDFQVCEFARQFCESSLYVQGLVQGNVTRDEAVRLFNDARFDFLAYNHWQMVETRTFK